MLTAFCTERFPSKKKKKNRNEDKWKGNFLGMSLYNPDIIEFPKANPSTETGAREVKW